MCVVNFFRKEAKNLDYRTNFLPFNSLTVHELHRYIFTSSVKIHPGLVFIVWAFSKHCLKHNKLLLSEYQERKETSISL